MTAQGSAKFMDLTCMVPTPSFQMHTLFSYYFCSDRISSPNQYDFVDVDRPCFLLMPFHICVVIWLRSAQGIFRIQFSQGVLRPLQFLCNDRCWMF